MSTIYSPIKHVGSGLWVLGVIKDHVACPLSKNEVEDIAARLTRDAQLQAELARARELIGRLLKNSWHGEKCVCADCEQAREICGGGE